MASVSLILKPGQKVSGEGQNLFLRTARAACCGSRSPWQRPEIQKVSGNFIPALFYYTINSLVMKDIEPILQVLSKCLQQIPLADDELDLPGSAAGRNGKSDGRGIFLQLW